MMPSQKRRLQNIFWEGI